MNICILPPERMEEYTMLLLTLLTQAALPDLLKSSRSAPEPEARSA